VTCTAEAILGAIVADPGDDLPRLAFADFCEEGGDLARAEFVRVQLELARLDMGDGQLPLGVGREALRRRERELFARLPLALSPPCLGSRCVLTLYPDAESSLPVLLFRRGFAAEATLPCAAWVEHGPALVRAAPLGRVTLTDREPIRPTWEPDVDACWWWVLAAPQNAQRPEALPRALFRRLDPLPWVRRTGSGYGFVLREAAQSCLSAAALGWARGRAGLPPLPPRPGDAP
jgi:uncharacterized protein (TIGR02996 family)